MSTANRRTLVLIAVLVAIGLGVRVWVTMSTYRHLDLGFTDNAFYHEQANALANGMGFTHPFELRKGLRVPAADHPPLFSLVLALPSLLGFESPLAHRLASCAISASGIAAVAFAASRVGGRRAAVLAAAIAAVSPHLWMNDGLILSESLLFPLIALVIAAAFTYQNNPGVREAAATGAIVGFAALTRSESALLSVVMILPMIAWARRRTWRIGVTELTAAAVAMILVIAPWTVRNLIQFEEPVVFSYGTGFVLELANCDATYSGQFLGYWSETCAPPTREWPEGDLSVVELEKRGRAMDFIGDHLSDQPRVIGARIGRVFGVFRPTQTRSFDIFFERRGQTHAKLGFWSWYALLPFAAVGLGAVMSQRGRRFVIPALAMVAIVAVATGMSFGITRYRVPVDVMAAIGAGLGLDRLLRLWRPKPVGEDA